VTVSFTEVTSAGDLTATVTDGDHPELESSSIDSLQSVNKYWTLTNGGIVFADYSAEFGFTAGDLDDVAQTDSLKVGRYAGGVWTYPTIGVRTGISSRLLS